MSHSQTKNKIYNDIIDKGSCNLHDRYNMINDSYKNKNK